MLSVEVLVRLQHIAALRAQHTVLILLACV